MFCDVDSLVSEAARRKILGRIINCTTFLGLGTGDRKNQTFI
jgi:hypothetical protein